MSSIFWTSEVPDAMNSSEGVSVSLITPFLLLQLFLTTIIQYNRISIIDMSVTLYSIMVVHKKNLIIIGGVKLIFV